MAEEYFILYVCVSHGFHPFICWWILSLSPCLGSVNTCLGTLGCTHLFELVFLLLLLFWDIYPGVKGVWEGLEPCRRHRLNMILDEEGGRENDRRKKKSDSGYNLIQNWQMSWKALLCGMREIYSKSNHFISLLPPAPWSEPSSPKLFQFYSQESTQSDPFKLKTWGSNIYSNFVLLSISSKQPW